MSVALQARMLGETAKLLIGPDLYRERGEAATRARLAYWRNQRGFARRDGDAAYVAVCDANIAYFAEAVRNYDGAPYNAARTEAEIADAGARFAAARRQ